MRPEKKASDLMIVMYHYVRDLGRTPFSKIHAIGTDEFARHLDKLAKDYAVISIADVRAAIKNNLSLQHNSCVLSFDDGLKDHYRNVFPILKKHKISGAFFPITATLDGKVSNVHKIQFLLAKLGSEMMISKFNEFLKSQPKPVQEKFIIGNKEKLDPRYTADDIPTTNLKIILQLFPENLKTEFLENIFRKFLGDEEEFARTLYLSEAEIGEMSDAGMIIGSHTHTHRRLDILPEDEVRAELNISREILEKITKKPVDILSYPYGNYNGETVAILKNLGYTIALDKDGGINRNIANRYALKRVDSNTI